jgi:hypothetical protein
MASSSSVLADDCSGIAARFSGAASNVAALAGRSDGALSVRCVGSAGLVRTWSSRRGGGAGVEGGRSVSRSIENVACLGSPARERGSGLGDSDCTTLVWDATGSTGLPRETNATSACLANRRPRPANSKSDDISIRCLGPEAGNHQCGRQRWRLLPAKTAGFVAGCLVPNPVRWAARQRCDSLAQSL